MSSQRGELQAGQTLCGAPVEVKHAAQMTWAFKEASHQETDGRGRRGSRQHDNVNGGVKVHVAVNVNVNVNV